MFLDSGSVELGGSQTFQSNISLSTSGWKRLSLLVTSTVFSFTCFPSLKMYIFYLPKYIALKTQNTIK
jgi:hypothetical protein